MAVLPNELWSCIIQSLRPSGSPVAIPAKHEVTKALLNLTLVSSTIRSLALPCLYTHCLYIDSYRRLCFLLSTLVRHGRVIQGKPLPMVVTRTGRLAVEPCILNLPPPAFRSLYLAPIQDTSDESSLIACIAALFDFMSDSLTHLVIDMPLRSIIPYADSKTVRPLLREAFQKLNALEEFTSTRDELYLHINPLSPANRSVYEAHVWASWPHLKRLALHNLDVDSAQSMGGLCNLQGLEILVLTCADGLQEASMFSLLSIPPLKRVLIVDTAGGHEKRSRNMPARGEPVRKGHLKNRPADVIKIDVPVERISATAAAFELQPAYDFEYENDPDGTCQVWTRDNAINGQLWDMA